MLDSISPAARRIIPPIVLGLAALSSLVVAMQLLLLAPELPLIAASFFGAAAIQGVGAWGLYQQKFWARGFGVGALLSSGIGVGTRRPSMRRGSGARVRRGARQSPL